MQEPEPTDDTPPPAFTYVRPRPHPNQDCEVERMISIEPISLRKGAWRHSDGVLSDLRHVDKKLGTIIFFGVITALLFYLFWRSEKSMPMAAIYTSSSLCIIAITFSLALGIDLFGAIGGGIM